MKIKHVVADVKKGYNQTIYVTKYALTKGILKVENARLGHFAYYEIDRWVIQVDKKNWHLTASEAVERAEEMRQAKIKLVKRQLAKLETMRFEEGEE